MKSLLVFILLLLLVAVTPLITIWAINTVFGLAIAYSFATWLAVCWLNMCTFGGVVASIGNVSKSIQNANL